MTGAPSRLAQLAAMVVAREFEPRLPGMFRYLTRGLGTRRTASPDILSLVMFQEDYLQRLVELGEADADAQQERIDAFLQSSAAASKTGLEGTAGEGGTPGPVAQTDSA